MADKVYSTPRKLIAAVSIAVAGMAVAVGANIAYTDHGIKENNRAWCDTINTINNRYQKLPPESNPDAKELAANIAALKARYEC